MQVELDALPSVPAAPMKRGHFGQRHIGRVRAVVGSAALLSIDVITSGATAAL